MKKLALSLCILFFCAGTAMADALDVFLDNLNAQAAADRHGVITSVGSHFGVPFSDVELIMGTTGSLADAFMILQIGRWTGLTRDWILGEYGTRKGQGWGVIAKNLGIKPGSAEFHALKNGDFGYAHHSSPGKNTGDKSFKGKGPGSADEPGPSGKGKSQGGGKGNTK